jgi:serine phosphatase RsbU (regulator of sigma subunit)
MSHDQPQLKLTDFMDLPTLQEIQDSFAAIANVRATITDADGNVLTEQFPTQDFLQRQKLIQQAEDKLDGPAREGREYVAPILIGDLRLGTIRMSGNNTVGGLDDAKLNQLSQKFGIDFKQIKQLAQSMSRARNTRPAAIQFLFLLANAIARLCFQEYQLRQRINELTAVFNVTMTLAEARDLNKVLQRAAEMVSEIMGTRSASIQLLDEDKDELTVKAVHNLSRDYVNLGHIRFSKSQIDQTALSERGYEYVRDMRTDPRIQNPQLVLTEGIVSMLSAGMRYKGKPIGVLRVYTDEETSFSQLQIDLLKAVASQAAAAIDNARLDDEARANEEMEKQISMAAEVQHRMIPQRPPVVPGLDISTVYVPCFQLGGDFFDLIELPYHNIGLVVADVSGKGVPASLIMASVRAALRAQVDNVFYLYEVLRRLNLMLCRDTQPSEFVTLFYGVLDANNLRLTYCNAGHPPALILRNGEVVETQSTNLVLGVNPDEKYDQHILQLEPDDALLLYTDGVTDAQNFNRETFGRKRLIDAVCKGGATATAISNNILWDIRRFVGLAKPSDDITMVVTKAEPEPPPT